MSGKNRGFQKILDIERGIYYILVIQVVILIFLFFTSILYILSLQKMRAEIIDTINQQVYDRSIYSIATRENMSIAILNHSIDIGYYSSTSRENASERQSEYCLYMREYYRNRIPRLDAQVSLFSHKYMEFENNADIYSNLDILEKIEKGKYLIKMFKTYKAIFLNSEQECNISEFAGKAAIFFYNKIVDNLREISELSAQYRDELSEPTPDGIEQGGESEVNIDNKKGSTNFKKCLCDVTEECDPPLKPGHVDFCLCDKDCRK